MPSRKVRALSAEKKNPAEEYRIFLSIAQHQKPMERKNLEALITFPRKKIVINNLFG